MRHWFSRALLATVLSPGILAAWAQAGQDPVRLYPAPSPSSPPWASTLVEPQAATGAEIVEPARRQSFCKRIYDKWVDHKSCFTTHNDYGCGTLKSTKVFIFGSCREFFGETCEKGPPTGSPVPPGYDKHHRGACQSPECLLNR